MKKRLRIFSILCFVIISSCGLPSNPVTPPEMMVTGETGATTGTAIATRIPFTGSPSPLSSLAIPTGYSLWGSTVVNNDLVLLAQDTSGTGSFFVSHVPLSTSPSFVRVDGLSGTPFSLVQVTTQVLAVLEKSQTYPEGCIELFNADTLVQMTGGGKITPLSVCQPIPAGSGTTISGGFLLPLADGVMFLAGVVTGSGAGASTTLYLMTQNSVLSGTGLSSKTIWTLPVSYGAGVPLSGVALPEAVLLPDPSSPEVDLFSVNSLYGSAGGTLSPMTKTSLQLSVPPTLLEADPARNFLLAGSTVAVALFGLNSILNPGGALGPLGTLGVQSGDSFGALTTYAGSS